MITEKIHDEMERLSGEFTETYGLSKFQREAVERLMHRAAHMVIEEQKRQMEEIAREVCERAETVTR